MQIINMKITDIYPYEKNPRLNDNAVEAVANSIKGFGFRVPIVIDRDNVIVTGHTRFRSAKLLGLTEVPCIIVDNLTPEQIKAYRIADNKTAEIAEWNFELLPLELRELQDADFDLSLLGFDTDELDRLLNGSPEDVIADGETDPDEVPEAPEEPISKSGEIYRLGCHLLMCGDAICAENVAFLMGDAQADLALNDAPYNVAYEGGNGLTIQNDNMSDSQFREFLVAAYRNNAEFMKPGAAFYFFHADSEAYNFRGACREANLPVHETLYWVKNSLVLGRLDYHYKSEPILYGWKPGAAHSWYSDRSQTNILEFDKPKRNDVHPTMKPVEILVYLIRNSSQRGEIVLDTFGGSGSTLIACEQTGRICRMMELDPKYCDVIRRRWAEFVHGAGCDWATKTPVVTPVG